MSKYIDADKLRSEVERIKETGCESPISVCNDILSFIDFLQQKPSEVNLEKEIDDFFPESYFETAINFEDVVDMAYHFYKLGLNARK